MPGLRTGPRLASMKRQTIPVGWLTPRPFTAAGIPWVYGRSVDA
jgi:hypothetical protein